MDKDLQALIAEIDAESAALKVVGHNQPPDEVERKIRYVLEQRSDPETPVDRVIVAAMIRITEGQGCLFQPLECPTRLDVISYIAEAWIAWAADAEPSFSLREWDKLIPPLMGTEAVALRYWAEAVDKLCRNERVVARLLWDRAIIAGSSMGLDCHPAVIWSYIGTFWPGPTSKP